MLLQEEIEEEIDVRPKAIKVKTPTGWAYVKTLYRTIPMEVWEVSFNETHATLRCSGHHLVAKDDGEWVQVSSLSPGDFVWGEDGMILTVKEVVDTGAKESLYDLTIDDPAGAYYSNGVLSHNSTTLIARQMALSHIIQGYHSLYVVPHHNHLKTYTNRFEEMEALWRFPVGKQLKHRKRYGRSTVELEYCGESAISIRGKTVDEVLIDEVQSFDPDLLEDVLYTQTTSKIPTTIYAGTALSVDTLLEAQWQESSMGVWHVRAGNGKDWLNMYDQDTLFKVCDNAQGPTCPFTGKLLDVTNGMYVHGNNSAFLDGRIGLHVPQCIIPALVYEPIQWMKIYNKIKRTDPKKVLQECFGIAVASASREITKEDLMRICILEDDEEQIRRKCNEGYYRLIVSGCDWGGSDYNPMVKTKTSYTVHCILGLAPDDSVEILHYKRYSSMAYPDIVASIMADHKAFNASLIASDFGVGIAYNMEIRKYVPFDSHFIMNYVGPTAVPLAEPRGDHLPNQLSLNRTEAITTVFQDLKAMTPMKIKARNWGEMQEYLTDWLNMYRVPTESDTGSTKFKYIRAATKADDALHAFVFAYTMMKFYMGEPLVRDPSLEKRIRDIMNGHYSPESTTPKINYDDYIITG